MPAAKKTTTRTPSNRAARSGPAAARRDIERRIARVEKLLEDAGEALQLLAKDLGRGGQDAYKELTRTVRALQRDAQRTNKRMLKDFDKLRVAVTPSDSTRRSLAPTTSRSGDTSTAVGTKHSTGARRSGRASAAAKRTAS